MSEDWGWDPQDGNNTVVWIGDFSDKFNPDSFVIIAVNFLQQILHSLIIANFY